MVTTEQPTTQVDDAAVLDDVSLEDYLAHYAANHYEWVEGKVIKSSPSTSKHQAIIRYLEFLFEAYFEIRGGGGTIGHNFMIRLEQFPNRRREPDLMVIIGENVANLQDTFMDGPPDICVEVVSEESVARDHGEKFEESEAGGVPEYWIVDPLRNEWRFYKLDENGVFRAQQPDANDDYPISQLPGLKLHVPTLWGDTLPGPGATVQAVTAMLEA